MAQGKPTESAADPVEVAQEPPAAGKEVPAGANNLGLGYECVLFRRDFREVTDLKMSFFEASEVHQFNLFEMMRESATIAGCPEITIGYGSDTLGHWVGWAPVQ